MSGRRRNLDLEDSLAALQQQQDDNLAEDDNAAPDIQSEVEEKEDPLLLAVDDLEGRVVSALDDIKIHAGVRSSPTTTVHEELATLLRPVLEVAAHTGPSVARTYYSSIMGAEGVEASCEEVYQRLLSDLVLPVMLEMAQSDTIPAKRAAALELFHNLWKETHKAGSWLDKTTTGPNAGPYGPGGSSSSGGHGHAPGMRVLQKRRQVKRLAREGEILRYWIQASIAATVPGAFTSEESEGAIASRGVIAASASLRPSLRHICHRIQDADDRGAARLYSPVMKMVEGVLKKLLLSAPSEMTGTGDGLRSACIKFLEIVILCCSSNAQLGGAPNLAARRRGQSSTEDFSLEDLPAGHPVITREALESIAEYAFTALRGLTLMGGQVKIEVNLLSDMMLGSDADGSPSAQVVSIIKPAALAFLEIESSVMQDDETSPEFNIDRGNVDMDFVLSQKSYALAINAVAALAINRPVFYKEAATCLARRTNDPPVFTEDGPLTRPSILAIGAHLRASCLTLLRNALSITTNGWEILSKVLESCDMKIQADKAVGAARQTAALKTAGRAARNRAAMFYEWDDSGADKRVTKRQRETDSALAKMRAAKAARGLGHGIQLPTNMVDAVDLILLNLSNFPSKRPPTGKGAKPRKVPFNLDYVVDAVMTNGASLSLDDGRWYDRDGGTSWSIDLEMEPLFNLDAKTQSAAVAAYNKATASAQGDKSSGEMQALFKEQCGAAASDAFTRIVLNSSHSRAPHLTDFGNKLAARLAWTLERMPPTKDMVGPYDIMKESVESMKGRVSESAGENMKVFTTEHPLVASCLGFDASSTTTGSGSQKVSALSSRVLNEAYLTDFQPDKKDSNMYRRALELYAASVVHASERSNSKPGDNDRKKIASMAASELPHQLAVLPSVTSSSLSLMSAMCDLEEITKKAAEASRKSSQQTLAASATAHAAKVAAEKRATAALLALRDVAFQRSNAESRRSAVDCAVGLAAGRLPATPSVEDKALKLVMNVLFPKSESIARTVVDSTTAELERVAAYAIENYDKIQASNKEASTKPDHAKKSPFSPASDEEKQALDKIKKAAVLFMALCVRRPEMIQSLMSVSCKEKADVLSKAVQTNMPKLAKAAATMHGAATIAIKVAEMAGDNETPMVLAFLDNLAPSTDKALPTQELIDACHEIQKSKSEASGKKDVRFIIPVLQGMKRVDLVQALPDFVTAEDKIFLAALVRMAERVSRQALLYRDEPDEETPTLTGMTLSEQLVYLHKMDFAAVGLPQKRYLDAIRLCLEEEEVFTDRVVMAALDYISGIFLTSEENLPLAYMRTIILTCSKHESLHSWICHVLLPRLIEGKVYTDRRQWEGWMRCAHMLENAGDTGVSSLEAIEKLPAEQLEKYRTKYPKREP